MRYKLRQIFPGSPAIDTVVEWRENLHLYVADGEFSAEKEDVEDYHGFWEEVKGEPLFVTYDGKSIYKGDSYYFIIVGAGGIKPFTPTLHSTGSSDIGLVPLGELQFSTVEAANEYVEENKPQYSRNQLHAAVNNWSVFPNIFLTEIDNFLNGRK